MIIILDEKNRYIQRIHRFDGIDKDMLSKRINSKNIKFTNYNNFISNKIFWETNEIILYTSSQNERYKEYINDVMYYQKDKKLVPSYDVLLSHENKFFQELYNRKNGIETNIKTFVIGDISDFDDIYKKGELPPKFVIKGYTGSASNNVHICDNYFEARKLLLNMYSKITKAYNESASKKYTEYKKENDTKVRAVIQEHIYSPRWEWRILVLGEKYFCYKRLKKDENTMASGAYAELGYDNIVEVPEEILYFAKRTFEKIDGPFANLDITVNEKNGNICLIEWSGMSFSLLWGKGMYNNYYQLNNELWERNTFEGEIDVYIPDAINHYIKEKKWLE